MMEDSSDVGGGGQDQVNTSFIKIFVLLSDGRTGWGRGATVRAVFQPPAESLLSLSR